MAHANGKIPASARDVIDTAGRTLLSPSAKSWAWVCDEVDRRYGWRPKASPGWTAYRTLAEQETVLEQNYDQTWRPGLTVANGGVRYYGGRTWYRRPGKATAAQPGTSNHGWARAVDVDDLGGLGSARYRQFADVATEAGWSNTEGSRINEAWHWVHDGVTVPKPKPTPKPTTELPASVLHTEEDTMAVAYIREKGQTAIWAVDLVTGQRRQVSGAEWRGVLAGFRARGINAGTAVAEVSKAQLAAVPVRRA